mgnify:CR=1 FL=1
MFSDFPFSTWKYHSKEYGHFQYFFVKGEGPHFILDPVHIVNIKRRFSYKNYDSWQGLDNHGLHVWNRQSIVTFFRLRITFYCSFLVVLNDIVSGENFDTKKYDNCN